MFMFATFFSNEKIFVFAMINLYMLFCQLIPVQLHMTRIGTSVSLLHYDCNFGSNYPFS